MVGFGLALAFGVGVLLYGVFVLGGPEEPVSAAGQTDEPTFSPLELREPEPVSVLREPSPAGDTGASSIALPGDPEPPEEPPPEPTTASVAQSPLPDEPANWPAAEPDEIAAADGLRDYGPLPDGAILGLTIDAIGIRNAPVWPDDSPYYLDRGVTHAPETSLPWSETPERNTYLAAHRIGYPQTGSRLLFYNLDKLRKGDRIVVFRPGGEEFTYRVTEKFTVDPTDSWVTGRFRGRDMVTLQTCTPVPTFEKRLIIRADRV